MHCTFEHTALEDVVLYNTQLSKRTALSLAGNLGVGGRSEIISSVDQLQRECFSLLLSLLVF